MDLILGSGWFGLSEICDGGALDEVCGLEEMWEGWKNAVYSSS